MNAETKIGYDGQIPEMHAARDLYGRGKRRLVRHNVNASRIEWLFSHDVIQKHQLDAGRKLQYDALMSEMNGYARLSAVPGTGGSRRLSDAKLDAAARVRAVCEALGGSNSEGWRILQLVVIEEVIAREVGRRYGLSTAAVCGALRVALNVAARHYGML